MAKLFKLSLLILLPLSLFSCGDNSEEILALQARLEASEKQLDEMEKEQDSTFALLQDGGCRLEEVETDSSLLVCGDGSSFRIKNGLDGQDGLDGEDGNDGADGTDGQSCSVSEIENVGALIDCGDPQSSVVILHGQDGEDGRDGQDGENGTDGISPILEYLYPCGEQEGISEVLIRMFDGSLLAYYRQSNRKQFLAKLPAGQYRTTDGYHCNFEVTPEFEIQPL